MIKIKNIIKSYSSNKEITPILKNLNCTINDGEFVSILGTSGCGKSTLLNILAGLTKADSGEIIVDGKATKEYTDTKWDNWRKKDIGIIFQNFNLIPHLNALENVELSMSVAAYGKYGRRKRAKELLKKVGLKERMKNKPGQLSGGQKQRVAIARALANNPKIILADEPTGALDSATSKEIMELLNYLNREENVTIIMVTHDEKIASQTDRCIRMFDGEIVEDFYLNNSKSKDISQNEFIKEESEKRSTKGMKIGDILSISFHNIFVKKKRSFLTIFGISVGVFSVILMLGVTNGISKKISNELNNVSKASLVRVLTIDKSEDDIEKLKDELNQAEDVNDLKDVYILDGMLAFEDESSDVSVYGINDNNDDIAYGEYPKNNDEIAVTKKVATQFMGNGEEEDLIGKEITVYLTYSTASEIAYAVEKTCTVVGITSENLLGVGNNYITNYYAKEISDESLENNEAEQNIYVYLTDKSYRENIINLITDKEFEIVSSENLIETINNWIYGIKQILMLITGISLVVAIFMVVIVQYMSVAERSKEIGILRAIGAKKKDVKRIFILEASIIGILAGGLGIITANALGGITNDVIIEVMKEKAFNVFEVSLPVIAISLAISVLFCSMAGYFPAKQAASVDTIEVLK